MSPPPAKGRETLYLIDGSAYIYRAYFALPPLSNAKGLQTNAIYGFVTMLMKVLRVHRPDFLAVAFDEKGPTLRHDAYAAYKAHRPEMPQGMQTQVPYIHRMVEAFRIPVIRAAGYEADDLIGTVARQAEREGLDVVIITGDKDMYQLVSPSVRIYDPVKDQWVGEAECLERFGVEPGRVVEVMGLMGDATDNIPGVKGIGEKTAIKLITEFGTIEALLRRVPDVAAPKTRALLTEQADQARLSRSLAIIDVESPIEFDRATFKFEPPPPEPLVALLRELEFPTLLKQVQPADEGGQVLGADVQTIQDERAARRFADTLVQDGLVGFAGVLQRQEQGQGKRQGIGAVQADFIGMAMAAPVGAPVYLPGAVRSYPQAVRDLLGSRNHVKAIHDLKATFLVLQRGGLDLSDPCFDTMIADYLLNPNRRAHSLEAVALDLLGYRLGAGTPRQAGERGHDLFDDGDPSVAVAAAESAVVIIRVVPLLKTRLQEQGSLRLFETVEMPLVPVLAEMERNGFALDVAALGELSKELDREQGRMMETITRLAGQEFNINSPKQLAAVLFDKLGLKPIRKTKTGYSTDEDTLTQLAAQHDLPAQILNYRSLSKLRSTYVDALPALVNPDTGRLHTSLNQTVAATGRLSSTDPNLQNIPVKGDYGLRIREAFVASPGHTLLCADYSQIEPRILAHLSRDERLLNVFEQGQDIHTATAVEIFDLVPDQITREMRRIAKTVVFGILYGISPYGLSQTLGVSQGEAKKYIDAYFERYDGVRRFLDRTIEEATTRGYTTTILGRRRPIPELQSPDQTQRGVGERMAVNSPIQGSAADLIKMAMIAISRTLHAEFPDTRMILQVDDELIFDVPAKDLEGATRLVKSEMERMGVELGLSVPLTVDVGVGPNWRAAHP